MQKKQGTNNDTPLVFVKFINDVILQDQTRLVNSLLRRKDGARYLPAMQNRKVYDAQLSPSTPSITTPILQYFKEMWGKEKSDLIKKLGKATDETEIKELRARLDLLDVGKIETAKSRERDIFQWLLIPYWLGDALIKYGEVVLRYYGCCWWGVSSVVNEHFKRDIVLYDVFLELTSNHEHSHITDNH